MDAVDAADPVEATERFLEDAAAEANEPRHHDEILWRAASNARAPLSFAEFKF